MLVVAPSWLKAVCVGTPPGRGHEEAFRTLSLVVRLDVPVVEGWPSVSAWTVGYRRVEQAGALEFAEDRHDAAGAVHVLHVDVGDRRRDLAEARHAARQPVDVGHGEVDLRLVGGGEQVQHGVGRAAHGDVERHRVLEGGKLAIARGSTLASSCS